MKFPMTPFVEVFDVHLWQPTADVGDYNLWQPTADVGDYNEVFYMEAELICFYTDLLYPTVPKIKVQFLHRDTPSNHFLWGGFDEEPTYTDIPAALNSPAALNAQRHVMEDAMTSYKESWDTADCPWCGYSTCIDGSCQDIPDWRQ